MNKLKRFSALLCASLLFMTGCSAKDNSSSEKESKESKSKVSDEKKEKDTKEGNVKAYGAAVSIEDIKKSYEVDDSSQMMPLYNVSQTEEFTFTFNFSNDEADIDMYDFVTVHTDAGCTEDSSIYVYSDIDSDDSKTEVVISPMEPKLKTESQYDDYVDNDICTWGNAPIYYLAVHYDMNADKPVHLDSPVVIPFTVTNSVQAPNAKGTVDADGRFKLQWNAVEGAEKYNIYRLVDDEISTGENNHAMDGSKHGYQNMTLLWEDETTDCEFDNFSGGGHGLVTSSDGQYVFGQNYNVSGEYYISAVVNGVESGLSAAIPTADLKIPYTASTEEGDNLHRSHFASINDVPTEMEVLNIDGSVSTHAITYTQGETTILDTITEKVYFYKVEGTAFCGYIVPDDENMVVEDIDTPDNTSGNADPEDDVNRIPDTDVETIIPVEDGEDTDSDGDASEPDESSAEDTTDEPETSDGSSEDEDKPETSDDETSKDDGSSKSDESSKKDESSDTESSLPDSKKLETSKDESSKNESSKDESSKDESSKDSDKKKDENKADNSELIEKQKDNTQKHITHGNSATVENVPEGVYINADSAEEEWLALNLVQGKTEISVEAFPALQDPYYLVDVFNKVYNQNPYILSVTKYGYDYNTMTFSVEYVYDQETIAEKQAQIAEKADEVIGSVIEDDMSDADKVLAIYDYLVHNSVYDDDALTAAESSNFLMQGELLDYQDSFNAVGILVNGKGVCASYAASFKVLSDLCGLDAVCISGYLNGNLPHAWNMVQIDGQWYEVDCTNNEVNSGIPYYLFEADTELAENSGYTKDKDFALDDAVDTYVATDNSKEYYASNGFVIDDTDAYKECLVKNVTADTKVFAVRCPSEFTSDDAAQAISLAFNELGLEDKLQTTKYGVTNGFAVVILQ